MLVVLDSCGPGQRNGPGKIAILAEQKPPGTPHSALHLTPVTHLRWAATVNSAIVSRQSWGAFVGEPHKAMTEAALRRVAAGVLRGECPSILSKRSMPAAARRNEASIHNPWTDSSGA